MEDNLCGTCANGTCLTRIAGASPVIGCERYVQEGDDPQTLCARTGGLTVVEANGPRTRCAKCGRTLLVKFGCVLCAEAAENKKRGSDEED